MVKNVSLPFQDYLGTNYFFTHNLNEINSLSYLFSGNVRIKKCAKIHLHVTMGRFVTCEYIHLIVTTYVYHFDFYVSK